MTYKLHESFPHPIMEITNRETHFELVLGVIGEFCLIATVARKGKERLWLTRYINLPGRPPD